jgi:hypothetical protein
MLKLLIFVCFLITLSSIGFAQFPDTIRHGDTIRITYRRSGYGKPDSLPKPGDIAIQFLAGEAAFNATFFIIAGNSFSNPQYSQFNGPGALALLASVITPPLAISLVSNALNLRPGSLLASLGGAFVGLIPIGFLLYPIGHPPTFGTLNLAIGIPIVALAELAYDLTIPTQSW